MPPPPLDLPNESPFLTRCGIAIGVFLLRLLSDIIILPRLIWPSPDCFKTDVETGKTGICPVYVYTPDPKKHTSSKPRGVVVHSHGGGWIVGRPEAEAPLCRYLCDQLGVVIVAPNYRKAPRYPYPHALVQSYSVLAWIASGGLSLELQKRNRTIEIDASRIALSGASSGSNIAASLTLLSLTRPLPHSAQICSLGVLYPALNFAVPYKDKVARVDPNWLLPAWMSQLSLDAYLPPPRSTSDPYVSPPLADPDDLARFPSTVVLTAAHDYLAHEAEEFVKSLRGVGVKVEHKRFEHVGHAFDGVPTRNKKQRKLNEEARDEAWGMIAYVFREALEA